MGNRLSSLDILRGLTIAIMILVNFQPDESVAYTILVHKPWEGITLADVAFPSFVFIMGASMALSKSGFQYGWQWRLLKRVMILFVLGLIYNHCGGIFALMFVQGFGTNELYDMWITHGRLMGVLQRLALSYGFAMLIFYFLRDNLKLLAMAFILMALSSLGYHLYNPSAPFDQLNNISTAVDSVFPGAEHNYCGAAFDPEGLYGTLCSTASVLLGIVAGSLLRDKWQMEAGLTKMLAGGVILLVLGGLWSMLDIISKPLWTPPYVLIMAGIDMLVLSVLTYFSYNYGIVERIFGIFLAVGRNPLGVYVLSGVVIRIFLCVPFGEGNLYDGLWLILKGFIPDASLAALIYAGLWFICFVIPAEILYRKKIIFTV